MTRTTWTWILAPGLLFLGACGIGTAAAAGGGGGSSSSGGGDDGGGGVPPLNEPPSVSSLIVYGEQTGPAVLQFDLVDAESDEVTVEVRVRPQGGAAVAALLLSGPVSSFGCQPQTATDASGLVDMVTSPTGVRYFLKWDFLAQGLGPGLEAVASTIEVEIVAGGGTNAAPGNPAPLDVFVGNDAPVIAPIMVAPELSGTDFVPVVVADSAEDQVRVAIEYRIVGDPDCPDWQLARPAGLPSGQPTPPFQLTTKADGGQVDFFWQTDFASSTPTLGCDLVGKDVQVDLRFRVEEILEHCEDTGISASLATTAPFVVDNNAAPLGVLDEGLLVTNPDARRGLPVPFRVIDEEGDAVRVLVQWRRQGQPFPALPTTTAELLDLLDDPALEAERELAQVATRLPSAFIGRVGALSGLTSTQVRLPELALEANVLLGQFMAERPLHILRSSSLPSTPAWSSNPLVSPVDAIARGDGTTALVLDDLGGSWRVIEVELATGAAPAGNLVSGNGTPLAFDLDPAEGVLVVATASDLVSFVFPSGAAIGSQAHGFASGPRAILSRGAQGVLATGDDKLVQFDLAAATSADVFSGLSTPWGLAQDPLRDGSLWMSVEGLNRVFRVDLEARSLQALAALVDPLDAGSLGLDPFPGPRHLALERDGGRLLVACDQAGSGSVRALDLGNPDDLDGALGGAADPFVFEVASFAESDVGLASGPDGLRIVSLPVAGQLALGGGVQQVRQLVPERVAPGDPLPYDPAGQVAEVSLPFDPALAAGDRWRLGPPRASKSSSSGERDTFLWDSRDVRGGGNVQLKVLPIDGDVGTPATGASFKDLLADLEVTPVEVTDVALQGPVDVRPVDLDGDGDLDLISVNPLGGDLTLFLQTAARTFELDPAGPLSDASAQIPSGFDLGDLDGDGDLDIVTANTGSDDLTIFLQGAAGVFAIDPSGPLADGGLVDPDPVAVQAVDLDGDGDVDLVSANSNSDNLSIWTQGPAGVFTLAPTPLAAPSTSGPRALASGDLDGDGLVDLVSVDTAGDSLTIFFQGPLGTFSVDPMGALELGPGATGDPLDVVIADLDGDGDVDLASADSGTDTVSLFFQAAPGDFHGVGNTSVGGGPLNGASAIEALDVDRDGAMDLVVASRQAGRMAVLFQVAPGEFELSTGGPIVVAGASDLQSLAIADLDGDGDPDFVVADAAGASSSYQIAFLDSPGALTASPGDTITSAAISDSFIGDSGDLDGDGDVDLLISLGGSAPAPGVLPLIRSPGGNYASGSVLQNANADGVAYVLNADLDEDGDVDIAASFDGAASDELIVFLQTAPGVFTPGPGGPVSSPSLSSPVLGCGDLDGDGDVDLVSANAPLGLDGDLLIFFQTAPGVFTLDPAGPLTDVDLRSPSGLVVADLDGDGDLDLATCNAVSSNITIFLQGAPGVFAIDPAGAVSDASLANPAALAVGDLDGDGDLDLVSANRGSDNVTVFLQGAPGDFALAPYGTLDGPQVEIPSALDLGDIDADGDLDILVGSDGFAANPSSVTLFVQRGPGRFAASLGPLFAPQLEEPSGVIAVDLDGDGELDVATLNTATDSITPFYNGR